MKNPRKAIVLGGAVAVLLLLLSILSRGWFATPTSMHPGQGRDGYVPCPAGTEPKAGQPHICVPT